MPRHLSRLALLAALVAALSAFLSAPAVAAPPVGLNETLQTEHLQIHYTGDLTLDDGVHAVSRHWVGDFAAVAEWGYQTFTSWGFPGHAPDADGLIDVYIFDFTRQYDAKVDEAVDAFAVPGPGGTGTIEVDSHETAVRNPHLAAHEIFHMLQFGMPTIPSGWFMESTAEWATFRLLDYRDDGHYAPHLPDDSIDCEPAGLIGISCGPGPESGGYTRWAWWQYLGERFGQGSVKEVWDRIVAIGAPGQEMQATADVLAGKGTSLADFFNDYSLATLTGSFQAANLAGRPATIYKSVSTPDTTKPLAKMEVPVNRLGSRYVMFKAPVGGEGPCYAATLNLSVALPAGTSAKPYLYTTSDKVATPLAVNGGTATISTGWDTCSSEVPAVLSLPNASATLDARLFVITGSVTVDTSKVVSGKTPPAGVIYNGLIINAPTEEPAPTLAIYAPKVLRMLGSARTIGFAVYSSGAGVLRATFGGKPLRAVRLRAGMNRVVLRLPKPAARLALGKRPVLELTSVSTSGHRGRTVVQRVAFKAKPKPKRRR